MTTNLEWLYENDREELINILIDGMTRDCWGCPFYYDDDCNSPYDLNVRCGEAIKNWLNSEYVGD